MVSHRVQAAICTVLGPCCFALSALATKRCGTNIGSWQKILLRSLLNLLFTLVSAAMLKTKLHPKELPLLALRGTFGCTAIYCYYESLNFLPVGNALMISRFHPFVSGLLSSFILGEPFTSTHLACIGISLTGVWMVAAPGTGTSSAYGSILAIAAAFFTGAAFFCVRMLHKRGEEPMLIILAFNGAGAVFSLFFGYSALVAPTVSECSYIFLSAVCMQVAQVCITHLLGLRAAVDASLSSFLVSAWGVFWGYVMGEQAPTAAVLVGCALICAPQTFTSQYSAPPLDQHGLSKKKSQD
jgi:drug/metabolite transporter (DMT)-like permease